MSVANIVFQAVLLGFVWGFDRLDQPWWSEGAFLGLACVAAASSWLIKFLEKWKVKRIEGEDVL
jgi:hypothetical protein